MAWDRPILTDSRRLPGRLARRPAGRRRGRRHVPQPPRRIGPPLHAGACRSRSRRRSAPDIAVAFDQPVSPSLAARRRRRCDRAGRIAGPSARWPPTRRHRPGAVRHHPGRPRAGPARGSRPGSSPSLPFDGICLGGLAGDETPSERDAALDVVVAAPRRRPAAALPDGPGLAGGPARGRPPRRRPVRFGPARRGSPGTARSGSRAAGSTCATSASSTTRSRSRRAARASPAGGSRGPTSPTCSGPGSCSPTVSRLVTT